MSKSYTVGYMPKPSYSGTKYEELKDVLKESGIISENTPDNAIPNVIKESFEDLKPENVRGNVKIGSVVGELGITPKAKNIAIDDETGLITFDLPDMSEYENAGGDVVYLLSINDSEPIQLTEGVYEGAAILNKGENTLSVQTKVDISLYSEQESAVLTYTPPEPEIPEFTSLEDATWEQIALISEAGLAESYFSVGETKSIKLNGTVGTLELSNVELYVYILGFNHNSEIEGEGISFGTFKTSTGTDVCLVDSKYGSNATDGTKYFNMQHWGNNNYGGWKGCDLRYDVLGSTDIAPSGYGSNAASGRTGYDASVNCAINPISNTLMSTLPVELRNVMKPITKYTDNVAGGTNVSGNVTTSVDYLPLPSEYEIHGSITYANSYEKNYQERYAYYVNGNSKVKYRHSSTSSTAGWWVRSPYYYYNNRFCYVNTSGNANYDRSHYSRGLSPVFLI